jgi:hypothetical protein
MLSLSAKNSEKENKTSDSEEFIKLKKVKVNGKSYLLDDITKNLYTFDPTNPTHIGILLVDNQIKYIS